jgi:hypothetical protein
VNENKFFQAVHEDWSSDQITFNNYLPAILFESLQTILADPLKLMPFGFKVAHHLFLVDVVQRVN